MTTEKSTAPAASRYAAKRMFPVLPDRGQHHRRCCDRCGRPLAGARGHGWPTRDGKGILCDLCTFPGRNPTPRIHVPDAELV